MEAEVDYYNFDDYSENTSQWEELIGPDEFTILSNQFTFNFKSDFNYFGGHVIFTWECMDSERFPKPPPGWKPLNSFVPEINTPAPEVSTKFTAG